MQRRPATSFASRTFVVSPRPPRAASFSTRSPILSRARLRLPIIAARTSRRCPRSSSVAAPERTQTKKAIAAISAVTSAIVSEYVSALCWRNSRPTANVDRMLSDSPSSARAARKDARCSALAASVRTRIRPPSDSTAASGAESSTGTPRSPTRSAGTATSPLDGSRDARDGGSTGNVPRWTYQSRISLAVACVALVDSLKFTPAPVFSVLLCTHWAAHTGPSTQWRLRPTAPLRRFATKIGTGFGKNEIQGVVARDVYDVSGSAMKPCGDLTHL